MVKKVKRLWAYVLTMVMIVSLMPTTIAKADANSTLCIKVADTENATISYKIGDAEFVEVDPTTADPGGNIRITGIAEETVIVKVVPNADVNIRDIRVGEGEEDNAPSAFNGQFENLDGVLQYTFPARETPDGGIAYSLKVEYGNNEQGPPQQDQEGPNSWNLPYEKYLKSGINLVAMWIGTSAGDITYDFSRDLKDWSEPVTITREQMEAYLNTILSEGTPDAASPEEIAVAKNKLFGLALQDKYMRILTGKDVGGDKLGFDFYSIDRNGVYRYNQEKTETDIKYYDYETQEWKTFDNQNFKWEDYLKGNGYYDPEAHTDKNVGEGLILDFSNINDTDSFYCHIPFDSRKNISWWNDKYKGEVAEAGDYVNDDQWVENGIVELVRVASEDGEEVYYSDDPEWVPNESLDQNLVVELGKAGYDHGSLRPGYSTAKGKYTAEQMLEAADKASGQCNVPEGSIVTVKLTPDPGYQILTAEINGMALTPDEGTQSQFSFKINSNIHFRALFEETKDVVDISDSNSVSDAAVAGGNEVVESGNVAVIVGDDEDYDTTKALEQADGDAVASVDVGVEQIVAKAGNLSEEQQQAAKDGTLEVTDENYWTTPLSELNNNISISLTLEDISVASNESLSLVRDHNGVCEVIPVELTTENGKTVATFESDKFSTYTFVKKSEAHSHVSDNGTRVEPTCEGKGSITYKCAKCGETIEVKEIAEKGHSWDAGTVTKEATETAEGVKTFKCKDCDKTKTEVIPKKEATKTEEPQQEVTKPTEPQQETTKTEEPQKGDKVKDDKNTGDYVIADTTKKEVTYTAPANKNAKKVSIPDTISVNGVTYNVTKIKDKAFKGNKKITTVTIGKNIASIGKSAFEGCKKLKKVTIKTTKLTSKKVGSKAFKGIHAKAKVKVPKSKLKAYKTFLKKKGLSGKKQKITK